MYLFQPYQPNQIQNQHKQKVLNPLKYTGNAPGTGKSFFVVQEVISYFGLSIVVVPTLMLAEQYISNLSTVYPELIFSNRRDRPGALIKRVHKAIDCNKTRCLVISSNVWGRIDRFHLQKLEDRNAKIYVDDCTTLYEMKIKQIRDNNKNMVNLYRDIFDLVLTDVFDDVGNRIKDPGTNEYIKRPIYYTVRPDEPGHADNFKYAFCTLNSDKQSKLSDDTIILRDEYKSLMYYDYKLISLDTLNATAKTLFVTGYYDLSKFIGLDVTYLANNFKSSVLYQCNQHLFTEIQIKSDVSDEKMLNNYKRLRIKYFVKCNKKTDGLTKAMLKDADNEHIQIVQKYLDANCNPNSTLWITNNNVHFEIEGEELPPNSKGSNKYMDEYFTCAWIAAMNPCNDEKKPALEIYGISPDQICIEREIEPCLQALFRTNLRDYKSSKPIELIVWDSDAAEMLLSILPLGVQQYITVEHITDVAVVSTTQKTGRKKSVIPVTLRNRFKFQKSKWNHRADTIIRFNTWEKEQIAEDENYSEFMDFFRSQLTTQPKPKK